MNQNVVFCIFDTVSTNFYRFFVEFFVTMATDYVMSRDTMGDLKVTPR